MIDLSPVWCACERELIKQKFKYSKAEKKSEIHKKRKFKTTSRKTNQNIEKKLVKGKNKCSIKF